MIQSGWRIRGPGVASLLACLSLSGQAAPAPDRQTLASAQAVGASLYAATGEVLLVTPTLRSREVAEGLRRAATERGVNVYLLADARFVGEGASYLGGLSLIPRIQVRLVRGLRGARATIDRRVLLSGPLLADVVSPLRGEPTVAVREPRAVAQASAWFTRTWNTAAPYRYRPPTPPARAR
ncbi:hypothetical protein [Deinococcus planocerae]|uniref:hypothetical protein n=1 Tax=Deinococcus planocerae TaxID=1737569 RepID=UPI000C7EC7AD|nr:hypothetical protein [Deinococcus planocerae]